MNDSSELDTAIGDLIQEIDGSVVDLTHAAGVEIFNEVHARAKGSIRDNLTITTQRTPTGAETVIQVEGSGPGGEEHHAVFLEYGTSKMPAAPFMRPGYLAGFRRAVDTFTSGLSQKIKG